MNEDAIDIEKLNPLPDSRPKVTKNVIRIGYMNWVPIFCASCGVDGGRVPEENCTFAFYLCEKCAQNWGNYEGTYIEPDCIFWEKVKRAQIETYGRELTESEVLKELDDESSVLSKLAKERKHLVPPR